MIEINLLAEELRAKKSTSTVDLKSLLLIVPVVIGIFTLAHIYLFSSSLVKGIQLKTLNAKWKSLEPERRSVEEMKKESNVLLEDAKTIQDFSTKRINWAQKLNKLSLDLPGGVWLEEISVSVTDLKLKGSVVSLQKEEVNLINKFLNNLKKDLDFSKDFTSIELGNMQRKVVGSFDVVDFTLSGKLK